MMKNKITLFLLLFLSINLLIAREGTGRFEIVGTEIYDPNGDLFIPRGVNVQGMKFGWPGDVVPQADLIIEKWNLNFLRVNCRLYTHYWNNQDVSKNSHYQSIQQMDSIVKAFTPRGVVVQFEWHDRTGSYYQDQALEDLKEAHREMISLWGDNPYVWFNIMNEPGGSTPNLDLWVNMHREVIEVIRDEMKADNVITVDAHYWGQDVGAWDTNPVSESRSSILSRGHDIINFNNKTYENINFSFHIYDQWNRGTQEQIEFKLHDFITRVKDKGFNIMIGEFGSSQHAGMNLYFPNAFRATMNVAPAHGVGLVWWHWYGGDHLKLTTSGNGNGGLINPPDNPANLTWPGQMFWDYTRRQTDHPSFITIHNPVLENTFASGTNVPVQIAAENSFNGIKQVRVYKNDQLISTLTDEPPYVVTINNIEAGRHRLKAVAVDGNDKERESSVIVINVTQTPGKGTVLYITGGSEYTGNEEDELDQILKAGFTFTHRMQTDARLTQARNTSVVVVSSTTNIVAVRDMFRDSETPVLIANPNYYPHMRFTGTTIGEEYGRIADQTQAVVTETQHIITEGFDGTIDVFENTAGIGFGKPASGAEILLTVNGNPDKAALFVFGKGSMLTQGIAAGARAAWYVPPGVKMTDASLEIFSRVLTWLSENPLNAWGNVPENERQFQLLQNFPNPVGAITTIGFKLSTPGVVKLSVIDTKGAVMETLVNEFKVPGDYSIDFKPSGRFSPGLYFYRLEHNNENRAIPMILQ